MRDYYIIKAIDYTTNNIQNIVVVKADTVEFSKLRQAVQERNEYVLDKTNMKYVIEKIMYSSADDAVGAIQKMNGKIA